MTEVIVGQIWREGADYDGWCDWEITEVKGNQKENRVHVRMRVAASGHGSNWNMGDVYNPNSSGVGGWFNMAPKFWELRQQAGPVKNYTTVECVTCHGFFVLEPGEERISTCPEHTPTTAIIVGEKER